MKFLDLHSTQKLVPRPENHKIVSCKWIFKLEEEESKDGTLGTRFKAHSVTEEFS